MTERVAVKKAREAARKLAKRKGYRDPSWVQRKITMAKRKEEAEKAAKEAVAA
jgi:hypothetical protein